MRFRVLIAGVALCAAVGATSVHAQLPLIDEIVVPFDAAGRVDRIDAELLARLARANPAIVELLGAGNPGEQFIDARLLNELDSTYVLDTLLRRGSELVNRRRGLSQSETDTLLVTVRAALAVHNPRGLASDNRTLLIVGSSLLGLAFYDWAVPVAGEMSGKEAVAAGMFAAAASFFVPFLATRGTQVSAGEANLALYGGTRGIPHGILAYHAFRSHRHQEVYFDGSSFSNEDEGDSDNAIAAAIAGSVVEGIGGYLWARGSNLSGSTAHVISVGGDIGLLWGLGYVELLDGDDDFFDIATNRPLCIAGLVGSGLGVAFGRLTASRRPHTWGDVEVVRMTSFVGAITGLAIADLASNDKENALLSSALAGSAGGLVLGNRLVRNVDLSAEQAILVDTGTLAGAALGLGIAYLATSNGDDESAVYTTAAALGAIGGGAATFLAVRRSAASSGTQSSSLQLDLAPNALGFHWRF